MTQKHLIPGLLLTLLVAVPALAASHDRAALIRAQDANGDGMVSKDEYAAGREEAFARMDVDKDGALSHAEYVKDFKARLPAMIAALPADRREAQEARELGQLEVRFGVLDSDRSGKITPAEFAYSGWMMFFMHDANRDGVITADDAAKPAN